jgi:hypothetical protein
VRGVGGYVIAAGSVTPDGEWVADDDAPGLLESFRSGTIPPLPDWLVEIIRTAPERVETAAEGRQEFKSEASNRERAWAEAALNGCYDELAGLTDDRHNRLNVIAFRLGRMVARGWLPESEVISRLEQACIANGEWAKKKPKQCRDTISSGLSKGRLEPHPDLTDRERVDPLTGEVFEEPDPNDDSLPAGFIEDDDSALPEPDDLIRDSFPRKAFALSADSHKPANRSYRFTWRIAWRRRNRSSATKSESVSASLFLPRKAVATRINVGYVLPAPIWLVTKSCLSPISVRCQISRTRRKSQD